jgi:hypothetical protein
MPDPYAKWTGPYRYGRARRWEGRLDERLRTREQPVLEEPCTDHVAANPQKPRRSKLVSLAELIRGAEQRLFDVSMEGRALLFEQSEERRLQRRASIDR